MAEQGPSDWGHGPAECNSQLGRLAGQAVELITHPPYVHWSRIHLGSQPELGGPLIDPQSRRGQRQRETRQVLFTIYNKLAWHTKQPLKAWSPVGPDAAVSPWGAASQPKGIIPAEHVPRK